MPAPLATITALSAAHALRALRAAGHDWETEARRAGVPVELAPEFGRRVAIAAVEQLYGRGAVLCGPDFALQSRPQRPEDNHSPVAMYCRTRSTVREGFAALGALWGHVTDGYAITFEDAPEGGVVTWHGPPRPGLWWFDLADTLASLRSVLGSAARLVRITTPVPAPPGAAAWFSCPIAPGPSFRVVLPQSLLALRIPPSDPAIRAYVERAIAALPPPVPAGPALVAALWSLGPTATLADLARATGTSERTLHRRLADAGTSFRAELDALRARLAADLAPGRSTDAVAELLGYSDSGAYRRAARRWTGSSPGRAT